MWEVIDAAKTKPFGFMPFYPGPGLGGHCIPVDPFYLSWKARQNGFESRFIELAGHINAAMPRFVVERVVEALNSLGKALRGSRVHLFGMAYKADVGDVRESPALDIAQLLHRGGASVSYSDPFVPRVVYGELCMVAVPLDRALAQGVDCALITTNRTCFDYDAVVRQAPLVCRHSQRSQRCRRRAYFPSVGSARICRKLYLYFRPLRFRDVCPWHRFVRVLAPHDEDDVC